MPDKKLICKDCGAEFFFTEGEQAFYREKGFQNEPVRCPRCRNLKKQQRRERDNYQNSRSFEMRKRGIHENEN